MEMKKVTSRKETTIRKKQESKTEETERGLVRRTKSELFIESTTLEKERLIDRVGEQPRRAPEMYPEHLEGEENVSKKPARNPISGGDFNRMENRALDTATSHAEVPEDLITRRLTVNDVPIEANRFPDVFVNQNDSSENYRSSNNEAGHLDNNIDSCLSIESCQNSTASLNILEPRQPFQDSGTDFVSDAITRRSTFNDAPIEADRFTDAFRNLNDSSENNMSLNNEVRHLDNNVDSCLSNESCQNSTASLNILEAQQPFQDSVSDLISDVETENSYVPAKVEKESDNDNVTVTINFDDDHPHNETLPKEELSVNVPPVPVSPSNRENKTIFVDCKGEEIDVAEIHLPHGEDMIDEKTDHNKSNILEEERCSMSSEDEVKNEALDREILERSVSYLISYFENLKSSTLKQNSSKLRKSTSVSKNHNKDKTFIQSERDSPKLTTTPNPSLSRDCYACGDRMSKRVFETTRCIEDRKVGEASNSKVVSLMSNNNTCDFCSARHLSSHPIEKDMNCEGKQVSNIRERRFVFTDDAKGDSKRESNLSRNKFNRSRLTSRSTKPDFYNMNPSFNKLQNSEVSDRYLIPVTTKVTKTHPEINYRQSEAANSSNNDNVVPYKKPNKVVHFVKKFEGNYFSKEKKFSPTDKDSDTITVNISLIGILTLVAIFVFALILSIRLNLWVSEHN